MIATLPIIFLAQFGWVLLLTFQQANVHQRRYITAFMNSLLIGWCQIGLFWFIPRAHTAAEVATFLFAGPLAVVLGMWLHPADKKAPKQKFSNLSEAQQRDILRRGPCVCGAVNCTCDCCHKTRMGIKFGIFAKDVDTYIGK